MSRDILIVLVGLFLAGVLRGFTGFGLALAAVPLLALALPPHQVIPVIVTAQLIAGLFDLPSIWRLADWRMVGWLSLAMAITTPLGFWALSLLAPDTARVIIGLLVLASVLALWRGVRVPARPSRVLSLAVGALSGLMNGLAAMNGPPAVVYFLAQHRPTPEIRASLIAYAILTAAAALLPFALAGLANRDTTVWTLIGLPALFAGQAIGNFGFRRTGAATHRTVALVSLSALAILLILRAVL